MKIAIASGKGGTGKTTVATNLAYIASCNGIKVSYRDCDVEEPNGHIFLKPQITDKRPVSVPIPVVDEGACIACGKCGEICQYSAIVSLADKALVFPELCHSCGGCMLVCPTGAISEQPREIGRIESGNSDSISFVHGILNIGEVKGISLIRQVKQSPPQEYDMLIVDSPPGTSCPVIESVRKSDLVVLVTEPTPFGLYDLKLAMDMVRALLLPFGVVFNRADPDNNAMREFCHDNRVEILATIPDDRWIAETYSTGNLIAEHSGKYRDIFNKLLSRITNFIKSY